MNIGYLNNLSTISLGLFLVLLFFSSGFAFLGLFGLYRDRNLQDGAWMVPFHSILVGVIVTSLLIYVIMHLTGFGSLGAKVLLVGQILLLGVDGKRQLGFIKKLGTEYHFFLMKIEKKYLILSVFVFSIFLVNALLRASLPTFASDSASTYLNAANIYLNYGEIIPVGNVIGDMARTGFLLAVYLMAIHSSMLFHVVVILFAFISVVFLLLFLSRLSNPIVALIISMAYLTSNYQVTEIIHEAKFDGLTFYCSLVAIAMVWQFAKRRIDDWSIVVVGLLLGYLSGVSYNNLFVALAVFLAAAFFLPKGREVKRSYVLLSVSALVACAPTYVENIFLFGNPFYPFFSSLFHTGMGFDIPADTFTYQYLEQIGHEYSANSVAKFFWLPLTLLDAEAAMSLLKNRADYGMFLIWVLGLWGIISTFIQVFKRNVEHYFVVIALLCVSSYAFWVLNQHILRYYAAGMPFLFILATMALDQLRTSNGVKRINAYKYTSQLTLCFLISFFVLWGLALNREGIRHFRDAVTRYETTLDYIKANLTYNHAFGDVIDEMQDELKPGDKIMSFITGSYYLGDKVTAFSGNGALSIPSKYGFPKALSLYGSVDEYKADLKKQGFDWVIINPSYIYVTPEEEDIISGFLSSETPYLNVSSNLVFKL